MTLCMVWRSKGQVHFASDSRLTLATNSTADVAIKVLAIPYCILEPQETGSTAARSITISGELGMCFAGSAVNSLFIKETVFEMLRRLQYIPHASDISMHAIASFIFTVYKLISREVCQTVIAEKGRADIVIGGMCGESHSVRVFLLSTDSNNVHSLTEILTTDGHVFLGSGKYLAADSLPTNPADLDYFNVLKSVIDDSSMPSVGGHIQYGTFRSGQFVVYGVYEFAEAAHYWRGAVDLNSAEFMDGNLLVPAIPYIESSSTLGV